MLTNNEVKSLKALSRSRERAREGVFVAEGAKLVGELLGAFTCRMLVTSEERMPELREKLDTLSPKWLPNRLEVVADSFDFSRISSLVQPQGVLATFELPQDGELPNSYTDLSLLLDEVQDPGNMGTIIRTADWFGVRDIFLSPGCVDPFSSKVVQASMGALAHVRLHKLSSVETLLHRYPGEVCGTFLGGEGLYDTVLTPTQERPLLIVMGNEGKGISPLVESFVHRRITIPAFPLGASHTESLNVGVATAIVLSEVRRGQIVSDKP